MNLKLSAALLLLATGVATATPSGNKWDLSACPCDPGLQCSNGKCYPVYRIAASIDNGGGMTLNGGVPYANVLSRMQNAFQNWTTSRVTACATSWGIIYGGTYASPAGTAGIASSTTNPVNNVIWLSGSSWRYSSATLGLTTTHFYTSPNPGQIFDADMELNNNTSWSETGEASKYDYESVVLHEAGHFLGLNHSPQGVAVMSPNVANGVQKRVLSSLDTTDVCSVYPGAAGSQGSSCTSSATCTNSRVCEGAVGSTTKICTQDCTAAGQSCPSGYSCQASTSGFACLPIVGAPDLCKFCASGQDCSTGNCLTDGNGLNWCSATCQTAANCGAGFQCQVISGTGYCVPTAACTNQCTSAGQCAPGYMCSSGTCRPTGAVGDRCEVSNTCNSCGACVTDATDNTIAYCRACCGGGSGNQLCQGCASTSCAGGSTCTGLLNNVDSVCLPSSGAAACAVCSTGSPCQSGLQCVNGRCYPSCTPSNPGSCGACYDQGNGSGICGCQNQLAHEGEPCGPVNGGGVAACVNGQACVGSPKVCRVSCELNNPGSCNVGSQCQTVDGKPVCVPDPVGAACAACNAQGLCSGNAVCLDGRCYTPCNVNTSGDCASCVEIQSGGVGVCACSDQQVGLGNTCGASPIAACQTGLACFGGTCRAACDVNNPSACFAGQTCSAYRGSTYCIDGSGAGGGGGTDISTGGGSGGTGGGTSQGTGGSGGGGETGEDICGCTSSGSAGLWAVALGVMLLRRRRV